MSIEPIPNTVTHELSTDTPVPKAAPEFEEALQIAQTYSYKLQYGRDLKATEKLVDDAYKIYAKGIDTLAQLTAIPKSDLKLAIHAGFFSTKNDLMLADGEKNLQLAERLGTAANRLASSSAQIDTELLKNAADLVLNIGAAQKTVATLEAKIDAKDIFKMPSRIATELFIRVNTAKGNLTSAIKHFKEAFKIPEK